MKLTSSLFVLQLAAGALAIPFAESNPRASVDGTPLSSEYLHLREDVGKTLAGIKQEFRGINWDLATSDSDDGRCTEEQLRILMETTIAADALTSYGVNPTDSQDHEKFISISDTAAWNRYFRGGHWGLKQWKNADNIGTYASVLHNIHQAAEFPNRSGQKRSDNWRQVFYRCGDPAKTKCRKPPSNVNDAGLWFGAVPAYTAQIEDSVSQRGPEITFCPAFFQNPSISRLATKRVLEERDTPFNIKLLDSRERAMIHEWMHVDVFGMYPHVGDLKYTNDNGRYKVYGEWNNWFFAWGYTGANINPQTAANADTYSWYFLYNYYHIKWGWDWDGNFDTMKEPDLADEPFKRDLEDADSDIDLYLEERDDEVKVMGSELMVNINPKGSDPRTMLIDYVDGHYDTYVANLGKGFWSVALHKDAPVCKLGGACREAGTDLTEESCYCFCDGDKVDLYDERCGGRTGDESSLSFHI